MLTEMTYLQMTTVTPYMDITKVVLHQSIICLIHKFQATYIDIFVFLYFKMTWMSENFL